MTMDMNRDELLEIIAQYLHVEFEIPKEKITPQANLFTDLEMDSIDALDLAATMKNELSVEINREELKQIRTVSDVIDYILRNRKQ